jgi:ATP phosphoribosyltransferase regulatory subunit
MDPTATSRLETITLKIQKYLQNAGYLGVIPSAVDYPETFQDYEKFDAFHLRDSLGEDLHLRSDATAQVIKGYANLLEHEDRKLGFQKLYYMVPVFRDVRKNYPKLREVFQVGIENIGKDSDSTLPDIIRTAHDILKTILNTDHQILAGDVIVFNALNEYLEVSDLREVVIARDVPLLSEILRSYGFLEKACSELSRNFLLASTISEWGARWDTMMKSYSFKIEHAEFLNKLRGLMEKSMTMVGKLQTEGIPISWEPLLVRKVTYYSGIVFEGFVEKSSSPPLRGGAYDNLVEKYSNTSAPASGFALDLSSLL